MLGLLLPISDAAMILLLAPQYAYKPVTVTEKMGPVFATHELNGFSMCVIS